MKKAFFILNFILFATFTFAQQAINQTLIDYLENLDKAQVPTGILVEQGFPMYNLEEYKGQVLTDSNKVDADLFGWLYMGLALGNVNDNTVTFSIPKSYLDNLPSPPSSTRMVINFGNGAGLRELNTATIQNDNAIWTINYSSFGDKDITIDIVSSFSPGSLFFKTLSKIMDKQPQIAYAQPDDVWTITTTQTWQRPADLNFAYPPAASSASDALFNSNK